MTAIQTRVPAAQANRLSARRVGVAVATVVALVLAALLFGTVGVVIGVMAGSIEVGAVARTVLTLLSVAVVLIFGYDLARGGPRWLWLGAGALAYVAYPGSWQGHALLASGFDLEGLVAALVDGMVWMIAVVVTVQSRPPMSDERINTSRLR